MSAEEVEPHFKVEDDCTCGDGLSESTESELHSHLHRSWCPLFKGLRRSTLSRLTPIRKRAKANKGLREGRLKEGSKEWREERQKVRERSGGLCELKVHSQCTQIAQGVHHIKSRSRGGSDYARNLLDACNLCNGWVEDNPVEARKLGLAKHFWEAES